jgi:hypothetical protein
MPSVAMISYEAVQELPSSLGLHEGYSKYMPLLPFTCYSVNNIVENYSQSWRHSYPGLNQ